MCMFVIPKGTDRGDVAHKRYVFESAGDMFTLKNFVGLRDPNKYSRSASRLQMQNKSIAGGMLLFSTDVIPTSLTTAVSAQEHTRAAVNMFQCVLGYMGDRQYSYAPMLAQEVLRMGLEMTPLRDELFCQLLKQITHNPNTDSRAKGLDLMRICLQAFAPSDKFINYVEYALREAGERALVVQLHQIAAEEATVSARQLAANAQKLLQLEVEKRVSRESSLSAVALAKSSVYQLYSDSDRANVRRARESPTAVKQTKKAEQKLERNEEKRDEEEEQMQLKEEEGKMSMSMGMRESVIRVQQRVTLANRPVSMADVGVLSGREVTTGWLQMMGRGTLYHTFRRRWFMMQEGVARYFSAEGGEQWGSLI